MRCCCSCCRRGAFEAIVPALILVGIALVAAQPWLARRVRERAVTSGCAVTSGRAALPDARWVWPAMLATGPYGGYFGAAFGVISMGVLGSGVHDSLQRLNALKNVLAVAANGTASALFVVVGASGLVPGAYLDWAATGLIALGSTVGGFLGARVGRRLSPLVLRAVIVVVGLVAVVAILRAS